MSGFQLMEPNGRSSKPAPPTGPTNNYQLTGMMANYSKPSGMLPSYVSNSGNLTTTDEMGFSRNPLFCLMCNTTYQNPCLLACYHTFCAACLKGRSKDGKLPCPLCGKVTTLRDGHNLPPADHLLRFLVESTCEDFPSCANCDRNAKSQMFFCNTCVCWSSQKDCDHFLSLINKETGLVIGDVTQLPMFYCNTCGQALCGPCRDETHRAKMFSQHEVIHMSKKTKEMHKKCLFHGEPFTMFCTSKKTMLCMKCFRDTPAEARLHCVDIDTAYNQGAKKLERALASIRELQSSLRDGVILFRVLLDELRRNMETERDGVNSTYNLLQDSIKKQYEIIIKDLESQYSSKDIELKDQLQNVGTMLPTVQMHSILCTTFASTANKHEFLNLAYQLIDRLTALAHLSYPLRPSSSSEINTYYKTGFAQCLEPITATFITTSANSGLNAKTVGLKSSFHHGNTYPPKRSSAESSSCLNLTTAAGASLSRLRSMPQEAIKKQTLSARGLSDKEFTKHCRGFEGQIKDLNCQFNSIRKQVSDLHRDVTTRRCLTSYKKVENIVVECTTLTDQLEKTDIFMQERKCLFHRMWDEEQQRITTEQAIFKEQLSELSSLRTDLKQLMGIARQLEPYIKSITSVVDHIQPEARLSGKSFEMHAQDEASIVDPELESAMKGSKRHHAKQSNQGYVTSTSLNRPPTSTSMVRYTEYDRGMMTDTNEQSQPPSSSLHGLSKGHEHQVSPPSDAPTPLPPPMVSMGPSTSARGSPYDRQPISRPSSREGMLSQGKRVPAPPSNQNQNQHQPTVSTTSAALEEIPVRDTLPTSMWCSTVCTSVSPIPQTSSSHATSSQNKSQHSYYSNSQFSDPKSILQSNGGDFPFAEPPFEYLTPAVSDISRKTISENSAADVKRGILSSILEKVRSKEEASAALAAVQKHLNPSQPQAPLASTESLTPSESTIISSKRLSSSVTGDSTSTVVHKPYEPPAIGKSSRVTPVGIDEEPERLSADSRMENESVEVVSLIRFSKSKLGSCSTTASDKPSGSSSDTNSLAAAALVASAYHHANNSCPACDMAAAAASEASRHRARSHSASQSVASSSQSNQRPEDDYDEYDYYFHRRQGPGSTVTSVSTARRSSAPEIDEKDTSRLSPAASSIALSSRASGKYTSRSLERPRSHPPPRYPYTSLERRAASRKGDPGGMVNDTSSSDSESGRNMSRRNPTLPPPLSSRYSVGSVDQRDLQRAVAHLQETLQEHMQHRVKAVVHRGAEGAGQANKTIDGDVIKHHETTKRNAAESAAKSSKQPSHSRTSSGSPMSTLGPYDTIKPSRLRRGNNNNHQNLPRQSSGDNLIQLGHRSDSKPPPAVTLKKADSFEGHEEAVRTLVEAVHESRKFEATRSKGKSGSDNG